MTNEDIIYHLNALILHFKANYEHQWNKKDIDVFECIVEKMSNSDDDCISREAVLEIAKSSKSNWIDNSVLFKRVNELPPVTPKTDVLDKIRAEIKEESKFCPFTEGLERALEIIDKYKAESEDKE